MASNRIGESIATSESCRDSQTCLESGKIIARIRISGRDHQRRKDFVRSLSPPEFRKFPPTQLGWHFVSDAHGNGPGQLSDSMAESLSRELCENFAIRKDFGNPNASKIAAGSNRMTLAPTRWLYRLSFDLIDGIWLPGVCGQSSSASNWPRRAAKIAKRCTGGRSPTDIDAGSLDSADGRQSAEK